ncbi:MAG TPA: NnrU family protein [Mizugakiibacter sp.]|nr:NnrU family protein [Mizugakiibacter sp.]
MFWLITGLIIFLGVHSTRIFVNDWRSRQIARLGPQLWKALYALLSLIGLALIVRGFEQARQHPLLVWSPPPWTAHLTALFTIVAFIFVVAAYVPRNRIKARLGHPMVIGVQLWAIGHLLATGTLRDEVLFGSFLLWASVDFMVARHRDRSAGIQQTPGTTTGDMATLLIGIVAWVAFVLWLHGPLIGIQAYG